MTTLFAVAVLMFAGLLAEAADLSIATQVAIGIPCGLLIAVAMHMESRRAS